MITETLILFFIPPDYFLSIPFYTTIDIFFLIFPLIFAIDNKEVVVMPYILGINRVKKAFAQRKVVNCIKQIGFAYSIIANKTIDPAAESIFQLCKILKVEERQVLKMHNNYPV